MAYKLIDYERLKSFSEALKSKYVAKDGNKKLSTNDYTNEDKAKVDNIPENPKYTDTVPDLSGYATKTELSEKVDKANITDNLEGESSDLILSQKGANDLSNTLMETYSNLVNDFNKSLFEKADKSEIPTKVSQLENDKTFKTETEIQSMIEKASSLKKEVVTSLPTTGKDDVIYLVKDEKGKDNNNYLEYLWLNGKYELIGSTQVDLSGYATQEELTEHVKIGKITPNLLKEHPMEIPNTSTYPFLDILHCPAEVKGNWDNIVLTNGVKAYRSNDCKNSPAGNGYYIVFASFDLEESSDEDNSVFKSWITHNYQGFIVAYHLNTGKCFLRRCEPSPDSPQILEPTAIQWHTSGFSVSKWYKWQEIKPDYATKAENALDKTKDKAVLDSRTDYSNNTLYTTPYFVQQACDKQIGERLRTAMGMMEGALDEKINVKDIQEFTQQELEEAFK